MAINKKLIHFENFSNFNSKKLSANKENTAYTVGVDGTVTTGDPEILYQSICWIKDTKQQWTHGQLYDCSGNESIGSTTALSGKINLTSIDEIKAAQSALSQTNDVAFYLVTDSSGKIPSSQGCYDIPSDIVKQLSLTSPNSITNGVLALATSSASINAVGVNVGDLVALTRVKVRVSDLTESIGVNLNLSGEIEIYQYKILSMNDAKPTGHWEASAGVMGLMSPWDKGQVNKISGIETTANNALPKSSRFPSIPAWLVDVNTCFSVGVYPTCSSQLNSPFTNSTYFTCIVQSTSTADAGGFDTIEQTAYGREGDTGLIYKRIIFKSSNDTQFGKWIKVSDVGTVPTSHVIILPSAGMVEIIDISSSIGYSTIVTNEDESEFHIAPSYFSDGVILVCDIDYSYLIAIDTDDEGNLIGTIIEKEPTKSQVYATKEELNNIGGSLNTYTFNIGTNTTSHVYTITQEEYDKILNADLFLCVYNEISYQYTGKKLTNDKIEIIFSDTNLYSNVIRIVFTIDTTTNDNGEKIINVQVSIDNVGFNGVITDIVNDAIANAILIHGLCETDLIDGAVISFEDHPGYLNNFYVNPLKPYILYIETPTSIYTLFGPTISIDSEDGMPIYKFKNDYDDKTIICTIKQYEDIGTINIEIGTGGDLSGYATKEELNNKQDKLENGVNIKTINGLSLLGSGTLTISGNSAYPQINHGTSNTTCMLQPNLFYVWDTVTELNLAFDEGDANEANEYLFLFTSGETATTLFVPDDIKWTDGFIIIDANKIYQISILNGLGTVMSWDI